MNDVPKVDELVGIAPEWNYVRPDIVVAEGLVIKPGDRLLVTCITSDRSGRELVELKDRLQERFPDVEITMLSGVDHIAVEHAT